jgi:hypothetical protein
VNVNAKGNASLTVFFSTNHLCMSHDDALRAGISEDRLGAAYTVGTHSGKKTIDGKTYIQYIVPRRIIPYPFSLGGFLHILFFAAEDPYNPAHFVRQMMRSVTVLSVMVLLSQTWLLETSYSATALYQRAYSFQVSLLRCVPYMTLSCIRHHGVACMFSHVACSVPVSYAFLSYMHT